jgi:hypothetical protein
MGMFVCDVTLNVGGRPNEIEVSFGEGLEIVFNSQMKNPINFEWNFPSKVFQKLSFHPGKY